MSITVKYFRIRILILIALVAASVSLATGPKTAIACEKCVFPTGGICVGCLDSGGGDGYNSCVPDQSTCTCQVGGGNCDLPIGP